MTTLSYIRLAAMALAMCVAPAAMASGADSVRVVHGQVSDYYIPVVAERILSGTVTDASGQPLEGATVMFFASPKHAQTDASGRFELIANPGDSPLYVYYPGMDFLTMPIDDSVTEVTLAMTPDTAAHRNTRRKPVATPWYDPEDYAPATYCNPMNISYNYEPYNNNSRQGGSFRSSADPMGLVYGDEFFLFSTNQNGFHYSKDLTRWDFAPASFKRRPADDDQCAPAAYVVGDTLFYTGSTYEGLPVWYTTNPKSGRWRRAVERNTLPSWDPCLFLDDDGRLYLYYGSSNEYPLKAVELSRDDFSPISKIVDVLMLHPDEHGWERFGMNNDDEVTLAPFTEGAYMTKHGGRYYLQYGAPGTEFKTYADGVYVADSPLGPFTYQQHNPMSYKPGGFIKGSGHGGTFQGPDGNYWHVSTCMLSNKYKFERRIGLYPTAFDADGVMYSASDFGDYPNFNATRHIADPFERFAGWMLLSYGKEATASSSDEGFDPQAATDNDIRTSWSAATAEPGEWLQIDLGGERSIHAIQVNYYDNGSTQHDRADDVYYQYRIYASDNGRDWTLAVDRGASDEDAPHDYIELRRPLRARYLRLENLHMPTGKFCVADLRVFGLADGPAPAVPAALEVARDSSDRRDAIISWQPVDGAYGYNIYYGTAPDKQYNTITVMGDTTYDMRGLDRDTPYWFSIEALAETGLSARSASVNAE